MRFSGDFRDSFGNTIARNFDKYCEFTNPVTFDALEDIYKVAFSPKEWKSLLRLMGCKLGRKCLNRNSSFDLYLPGARGVSKYHRKHITFGFPDGKTRPSLDIEFADLHPDAQVKIESWLKKATALKKLRQELWQRCDRLLDDGWDKHMNWDSYNGKYRGGGVTGQGCNTPGQVYRIWPELLVYLPAECRDKVRNATVKSKLPSYIKDYGSVEQFLCLKPSTNDDGEMQSVDELNFARRRFDALTHILLQMSLMTDVAHVQGYPLVN